MDAKTVTVRKNYCVLLICHLRQSLAFKCSVFLSQASVKPRCGRMVGFSSGGENPHGVRAVTRGQRCAVALWFTLDPLYRELVRKRVCHVMCMSVIESTFSLCLGFSNASDILTWWHVCIYVTKILSTWKM